MSMIWMKLEAQTSVPSLYFLLISRNKVKIVFFFCLFPGLSVQYKNIPEIKVLRMPCQFNMIFSGIFLYYMDKPGNRQKNTNFTLILLINRKYKEGTEGCASSFIHLMLIKKNPLTRLIKSC